MTTPKNPIEPFSPYLPATFNIPVDNDRFKVFLDDHLSNISDVVNDKKIGSYTDQAVESKNGEKWHYSSTKVIREGSQAIMYIPSLPNNTTVTYTLTSIPMYPIMNTNNQMVITKLFGTASKPPTTPGTGDYFQYNNQGDTRITFTFSDTQVVITTTTNLSGYSGFIVVEYLRRGN